MFFTVFAAFLAIVRGGCDFACKSDGAICAKDERSNGPQNFNSRCHMNEENCRGGSEFNYFESYKLS